MNVEALLASPHWRWMPGMQCDLLFDSEDCEAEIAVVVWPEESGAYVFDGDGQERSLPHERLSPRLHAPATLGCLLALVREAWGRQHISTKYNAILGWIVKDGDDDFLKSVACDTEAEALVAALLAAPLPGSK